MVLETGYILKDKLSFLQDTEASYSMESQEVCVCVCVCVCVRTMGEIH